VNVAQIWESFRVGHRNATLEEIRELFGDYQNVLNWLATFLLKDEDLANDSTVDACTIAESQTAAFHEWLIYWGARATVRVAMQKQYEAVATIGSRYDEGQIVEDGRDPLSVGQLRSLVQNSGEIAGRLDLFCRFVLVLRGIAQDSFVEVGRQLGVSVKAVVRAYSVAIAEIDSRLEYGSSRNIDSTIGDR
jgi:hypothetical protein